MGKSDKKKSQGQLDTTAGVINPASKNYYNTMWGGSTPGATAPGTMAPGSNINWNQQTFSQMFGTPRTGQELLALEEKLKPYGIQVVKRDNPNEVDKIRLPSGQYIDIITAVGSPGAQFAWQPGDYGQGSGGVGFGGGVAGQAMGDYSNLMGKWGEFADTGGYSPEGLAAIRSRALSPIRSIYSNATRELDRTRALQGGYSPGYATARARMARQQGQTAADASTNAEAAIAEMVQRGRMGGLTGMSGMYSATPGLANMFGQQGLEAMRNQLGLVGAYQNQGQMQGFPWSQVFSGVGAGLGAVAPFLSDRNAKEDIEEVSSESIVDKMKKLKIYEWRYKGDTEKHIGPMAQDFKRIFGKGDGKTISPIDAIGVSLAMNKALAERA